jgi:hypothetical protein
MAGNNVIETGDAHVYEATAVVDGGMLVVPSGTATNPGMQGIAKAGDAAVNVLGVAARRAEPLASQSLSTTDADGYPVTYPNPVNELTTVYKHRVVRVTYTAVAVAFGVKLCAAANGQVRAWVSGTDPASAIVGESRDAVPSSGGSYRAFIY